MALRQAAGRQTLYFEANRNVTNQAASRHSGWQVDAHVGVRIRQRRTELGLTQEQLANSLEVSYQQIQKYETGANRIAVSRLVDIARRLKVDMGYFFDGLDDASDGAGAEIERTYGSRSRSAIDLVRKFDQIDDGEVRGAIAGLVKTIVERRE